MARIFLSPPHMGTSERELLLDAFDSNWIAPLGPHVDAFEREVAELAGMGHAAAVSSGTAGLHLALVVLGVEPADRVYVSDLTFAATANAVTYAGAEPVFIDSESDSWNVDADLVAEALRRDADRNRLPRALVAVDLYGQCADYAKLRAVCSEYGVPIVEDAAEALGAFQRGRPAGSFGDLGVFSFNGNKIITTSGGGMLVGDDAKRIERARFLSTQARDPAPHYEHSVVGYNYRLSNLLAAVGRGQLRTLGSKVERRREIFERYSHVLGHLPGWSFMPEPLENRATRWLTVCLVDPTLAGVSRTDVIRRLAASDIEARPVWKPMHLQPVFEHAEYVGRGVSDSLFAHGLCLPSGSSLSPDDQKRVIETVLDTPGLRF